jgi:transposase
MTAAVNIIRVDYTAAELCDLAVKSRDAAQSPAVISDSDGVGRCSREDAARQAGMDRQPLRAWVHRYKKAAADGLISRSAPGPLPKLNEAQLSELREVVIAGPNAAIHQVVRWRCVDLRDEVARHFEVTVGERAIGKWLRKLGLTRLQPRPYHPRTDPAVEEAFKKTSVLY